MILGEHAQDRENTYFIHPILHKGVWPKNFIISNLKSQN